VVGALSNSSVGRYWCGYLYILLISVSGRVIVFRNELYKSFVRPPLVVEPSGTPLTDDELKAAAKRAYPGWTIANVWRVKNPNQVVRIGISNRVVVYPVSQLFRGRGMKRCLAAGRRGLELLVGVAVLANNLLRIAAMLLEKLKKKGKKKVCPKAA